MPLSLCFVFFTALTTLDIPSYSFDYMKEASIEAKMTKREFCGRYMHSYNVTLCFVCLEVFFLNPENIAKCTRQVHENIS